MLYEKLFSRAVIASSTALIVATLAFYFFSVFTGGYTVTGASMNPTLLEGDRVYVNEETPVLGDVVVATVGDKTVVKRVYGTPGDTISYDAETKKLTIGEYTKTLEKCSAPSFTDVLSSFFLIGDNESASFDSLSRVCNNDKYEVYQDVYKVSEVMTCHLLFCQEKTLPQWTSTSKS